MTVVELSYLGPRNPPMCDDGDPSPFSHTVASRSRAARRGVLLALGLAAGLWPAAAAAAVFHYCVAEGDVVVGNLQVLALAGGEAEDVARAAASEFCAARGRRECQAAVFDPARCGALAPAAIKFTRRVESNGAQEAAAGTPARPVLLRPSLH
jgi:hypothetical protein